MKNWGTMMASTAILLTAQAWADEEQNNTTANKQAKSRPQLEEIIVTAQKRAERLQDVPVSVSAFSAHELADISFDDVDDLVDYVPSLTVGTNVSPLSTSFRIRNVGKFSSIPSFEPAVGLFIDGAFRARSGLGLGDIVDVSAVEVLKGPQSTLYGKNVSAGVISVATQQPTREFEAMIETTIGDTNLRQTKGYVSGPLSGKISGRLSAVTTRSDAYMENLIGEDHNDRGSDALRAQLLFDHNDEFSSRLIIGYVDKDLHPKQGDVFVSPATTEIIRNAGGQVTNNDPRDGVVEYDDFNRFTMEALDIILNNTYQTDDWSLTSITSYDTYDALSALHDAEQMSLSIAIYDDTQIGRTFSQEIRFDTNLGNNANLLAGLYYYENLFRQGDTGRPEFVLEEEIEELGDAIAKYVATHSGPTPGGVLPAPIPGPPVPLIGVEGDKGDFLATLNTTAFGVFSKFDYQISEAWGSSLGLRYSQERKAGSLVQSLELSPLGCVPPLNASFICSVTPENNNFAKTTTFSAVTGALQTNYRITDDFMVYATASTGFKSGGYSLQNGTAPAALRPYNSEEIANYEIGWKAEFFDNRARLNGALFNTEYKDYQEASYKGLFFVVNTAELVTVKGFEVDGTYILNDNFTLGLDIAYVDSIYDKYTQGQCYYGRTPDNADGQCDLSGENLPVGAKFNGLASIQWETDLFQGSVYSRADYIYKSAVNSSSEIDPRHDQPALARINLKLGWRSADWDISLGVKNATNEEYVDQSANANVLTPIDAAVSSPVGSYQNYIGDPREVALSMRLTF
jgi:iron complex outermembrane receptor protein